MLNIHLNIWQQGFAACTLVLGTLGNGSVPAAYPSS